MPIINNLFAALVARGPSLRASSFDLHSNCKMDELAPMKNEETCYVAEDQDEGIDRAWWCAVSCPAYESCTKQGWKRAACWSYESEAQVQAYVLNHLMESSLHAMEEDMARTMALDTEIEQLVETAKERAGYRKQCEQLSEPQSVRARSRSPRTGKGGKGKKGKGKQKDKGLGSSMNELNENVKALAAALTGQGGRTNQSGGMPASSKAIAPTHVSTPAAFDIVSMRQGAASAVGCGAQISRRDLMMLQASLGRAYFAATSGHSLLTQLSQQFQTEAQVLSHAKQVVDDILANTNIP